MKNMMLITSSWKNHETFKLIPTTQDCPYVEGIYDREIGVLALIGNVKKQQFHMVPKLDANGDPEMRKVVKDPTSQKPFKEERRSIETFQEYYLQEKSDIDQFINHFVLNADFNYSKYFEELPQVDPSVLADMPGAMMKIEG